MLLTSVTLSVSPFGLPPPPKGNVINLRNQAPIFLSLRASAHTGVAIRSPLQRSNFVPVPKEKTDCHVASLLAMTVVDGTPALKLMTLPQRGRQGR